VRMWSESVLAAMLAGARTVNVAAGRLRCHAVAMYEGMLNVQSGSLALDHQMCSASVLTHQCRNVSPFDCAGPKCNEGVLNHCVPDGVGVFHIDDAANGRALFTPDEETGAGVGAVVGAVVGGTVAVVVVVGGDVVVVAAAVVVVATVVVGVVDATVVLDDATV